MKNKNEVNNLETSTVVDVTPNKKNNNAKKISFIIAISIVVMVSVFLAMAWIIEATCINNTNIQKEVAIEYTAEEQPITIGSFIPANAVAPEDMSFIDKLDNSTYQYSINGLESVKDIGEYDYQVTVMRDKSIICKSKKYDVKLIVEDTNPPVFDEANPKELEFVKDCKDDITDKYIATDLQNVVITFDDKDVDYSIVGEYNANVYATDKSGNIATYEVAVKIVEPTISVEPATLDMTKGNTSTLTATVKGKEQTVEWSSSDESVAKVDNGKVTANKEGTTKITAKANGVEATCEVTVKSESTTKSTNATTSSANKSNNSGTTSNGKQTTSKSGSSNNNTSTTTKQNNQTSATKKSETTTKTTKHDHSGLTGNIGKWFDSRADLTAYYNSVTKVWSNKCRNEEITWEEYYKNCPDGYECWSCAECGKWTGNFYY